MAIDVSSAPSHPDQSAVHRLTQLAQGIAPPVATALAYMFAAQAGAWLAFPSAPVSALWAPNAILIAALLLTRRERWWIYLLAVLPFHFLVQLPEVPITRAAIQYFANCAEAILGAWVIVKLCPNPRRFDRLRTVAMLIVMAGIVSPAVTSLLMVGAFELTGIQADFWLTVVVRTITNTFAITALVPLIVHSVEGLRANRSQVSLWQIFEAAALAIALAAVCIFVFALPGDSVRPATWLFAPLPLLAWATIRFRVTGACSSTLLVGAISAWGVLNGNGPFVAENPIENAVSIVSFHVVICLTFVLCGALLEEWRHASRALGASEARFRSIFEHNIIPTAIWQGDYKISDANDAFVRLTGFARGEITGGELAIDELATGIADGRSRPEVVERELTLPGGRRVPVILGQTQFAPGDGGVLYALDLSPFRSAEARRMRAEGLHAAVLDSVHDEIAVLDSAGTIIEVNESWRRATQLAHPARFDRILAGESYLDASVRAAESDQRAATEHLAALREVLDGRETRCNFEYQEPSGMDQAWIEVTIEKLQRTEGGAIITRANISDRKRAEHEARVQQQQLTHLGRAAVLGQLSGAFAHELNQPLTSILSNAEAALRMIASGNVDPKEIEQILCDIVQADLRASQVIDRLRSLLDKGDLLRRPVDLNATVCEVLDLAKSELITRNVHVGTALDRRAPVVIADRVQMQQVVLNLLMNACDAMSGLPVADRKVQVDTRFLPEESSVEITVKDGGCGIAAGDADRIFHPFVTTKPHGMGMGLAICRSVAEAHRGRLWVESTPGSGATFHLRVPVGGTLQ